MESSNKKGILSVVILAMLLVGMAVCVFLSVRNNTILSQENDNLRLEITRQQNEIDMFHAEEQRRQIEKDNYERTINDEFKLRTALKEKFLERNTGELFALVNPWNNISSEYEVRLTEIGDGMTMDERASGALEEMLAACRKGGGFPCPISAYRTQEYQQELFDNKIARLFSSGYSLEKAQEKAAESVAVPGTSEHQLGFAVDIVDEYYPELDYAQEWTGTQQWLMRNCSDYGFILRYPSGTSEKTGIIFEPWHYRYVGKTAAKEISELGITFEEYVEMKSGAVS